MNQKHPEVVDISGSPPESLQTQWPASKERFDQLHFDVGHRVYILVVDCGRTTHFARLQSTCRDAASMSQEPQNIPVPFRRDLVFGSGFRSSDGGDNLVGKSTQ